MTDQLKDWQLALLVEARKFEDPVIVEAHEAKEYAQHKPLIDQADDIDRPVVVDQSVVDTVDRATSLLEAAEGVDDPRIVEADEYDADEEALEAVSDALVEALGTHFGIRESVARDMTVPAMVNQFRDDDDDGIDLESLAQTPETGSATEEEIEESVDDDDDPYESLESGKRAEVTDLCERADAFEDRLPKHAESLRQEAADIVGVDVEDLDVDLL